MRIRPEPPGFAHFIFPAPDFAVDHGNPLGLAHPWILGFADFPFPLHRQQCRQTHGLAPLGFPGRCLGASSEVPQGGRNEEVGGFKKRDEGSEQKGASSFRDPGGRNRAHPPQPSHDAPIRAASLDYDIQGRLTLAILQQQVIKIHYRKLEAEDGYAVSVFPHRLIHRDQSWYLIAEDLERGGQRTYAVPRISQVAVQARPEGFEVPTFVDHYQHAFGIWTPYVTDGPLHDVCVELTDYWARIARERQWHPSQQLDDLASDRVRVRFRLSELVEVKSWVLSFGSAAIVIAPRQLREMVIAEFEAGRGNYR